MLSESLIDSKQFKTCKYYPEIVLIGGTFSINTIKKPIMLNPKKVTSVSLIEVYGFCSQLADSSFRYVKGLGKILESKLNYESTVRDGILGVLQSDIIFAACPKENLRSCFSLPFWKKSKHCKLILVHQTTWAECLWHGESRSSNDKWISEIFYWT